MWEAFVIEDNPNKPSRVLYAPFFPFYADFCTALTALEGVKKGGAKWNTLLFRFAGRPKFWGTLLLLFNRVDYNLDKLSL